MEIMSVAVDDGQIVEVTKPCNDLKNPMVAIAQQPNLCGKKGIQLISSLSILYCDVIE